MPNIFKYGCFRGTFKLNLSFKYAISQKTYLRASVKFFNMASNAVTLN